MQKRIGRRARERENWSNFAEWPSLLLPNVKPTILENRKLTICKGVGQSNTNWDSCTNIFSQEISKIKYAIIVSIQILLTYLLIYFFVYATTRRRHTRGEKHLLCWWWWGGRRKRKIKQRGLVHDLTIQHWNDYCKDSPLFFLSLSSLPKLIK